jgi:hypothetical protein
MKTGITTSEFWIALVAQILGVIALVDPQIGDVHRFDGLVQAFGVLAAAIASAAYAHSRAVAKAAFAHADAAVKVAQR